MNSYIGRTVSFTLLAVVNYVIIYFLCSSVSLLNWIFALLIVLVWFGDVLVILWSFEMVPDSGWTDEARILDVWSGIQIAQVAILPYLVILNIGPIGLISVFPVYLWIKLRSFSVAKLMDSRYW